MNNLFQIGLAGLGAASTRAQVAGQNIANLQTPGYKPVEVQQVSTAVGPAVRVELSDAARRQSEPGSAGVGQGDGQGDAPSDVDLAEEIVDLTLAKTAFKASAAVIRTGDDLNESLLDILA